MNLPQCVEYFSSDISLEDRFKQKLDEYGVPEDERRALLAFMSILREKDPITLFHYYHSIRVGLVAARIAEAQGVAEKALLYAGGLHDIGKALVCLDTLGKTDNWTPKDSMTMKTHVDDSYKLIRGRFDFAADVLVRHHHFQKDGYPKRLPKFLHPYSPGTKARISWLGRMLAIADVYDALHRINFHDGAKKALTGEEIREKMFIYNPDAKDIIESLYARGVLTIATLPVFA